MAKANNNKPQYAEILVAPVDQNRFKKGCEHYGLSCQRIGRSDYYKVGYSEASDLYWLGANMYGHIKTSSLCTAVF